MAVVAALVLFSWVNPYFGEDNAIYRSAYKDNIPTRAAAAFAYTGLFQPFELELYENPASPGPRVAGAGHVSGISYTVSGETPNTSELYIEVLAKEFGIAASEVLDISGQIQPLAEFYAPGASAAWDAWLELMADPEL